MKPDAEIGKYEFLADGVAVAGFAPAFQPRQRVLASFGGESLRHMRTP